MNAKEYLEKSGRTAADTQPDYTTYNGPRTVLANLLEVYRVCTELDTMKRSLYYKNHDPQITEKHCANANKLYDLIEKSKDLDGDFDQSESEILHGILGVGSEVAEMIEALITAKAKGQDLDRVNLIEEVGDVLWYLALILRSVDGSFEDAMERNINKLLKRFPEKFNVEQAVNRDLEAEREVLQS